MNNCLITGGAGFIGVNLAQYLIQKNKSVRILDNLSRKGVDKNLAWLNSAFPGRFEFIRADIRNFEEVRKNIHDIDTVFHFASQVAVTTSVEDPRTDFEVNALGALNVLEAARILENPPSVLFTSTNKVYGKLSQMDLREMDKRYQFPSDNKGVDENQPLDFYSPYGCSKGAADQYIRDYSRIYGLQTTVFRMSCIYGPHQFGNEDQGWVAHFVLSALLNRPLKIFGNGKQVRDILYVDDLVRAFCMAAENPDKASGGIFNIGGGCDNSVSLLELMDILRDITGNEMPSQYFDWRPGDQKIYISDIKKAEDILGWKPEISAKQGILKIYEWIKSNRNLF
ncbi:GDP-mannose 4,6-dehydratase [Candidatus Sumerlaeota bacterium]|nr:GDP-mannose 4,6-dehydratase [Candidatus Sumerlaeota bacterium]